MGQRHCAQVRMPDREQSLCDTSASQKLASAVSDWDHALVLFHNDPCVQPSNPRDMAWSTYQTLADVRLRKACANEPVADSTPS